MKRHNGKRDDFYEIREIKSRLDDDMETIIFLVGGWGWNWEPMKLYKN